MSVEMWADSRPDHSLVIGYQDADEFKPWWDRDAQAIAETVKAIGRVEEK